MRTADSHSEVSIMARMMVKMNITTTMMILQVILAAWPHLPLQTKQDQPVVTSEHVEPEDDSAVTATASTSQGLTLCTKN